jgi:predicted ATPase/serine/threonine protein kinase
LSRTPRRLGKYELQELLGQGGMAEVWKGYDTQLQRHVAIKLLHPNLQADPNFITRFTREAQTIAALRHPNIVQIYDFHVSEENATGLPEAETIAYMVMEYIKGCTLADYIDTTSRKRQFPSTTTIIRLFTPISLALDYAHAKGMTHRDIKPANILLDQSRTTRNPMGEPILSDFGLTKGMGAASQTAPGLVFGTPLYISPEQVQNHSVTKQTDIYALAVVFYEILTGGPPFQGESLISIIMQHLSKTPTAPHLANPDLSPTLSAVLLKGLAKNPSERYSSAAAMTTAIAQALNVAVPEDLKQTVSAMAETMAGEQGVLSTLLPTRDDSPPARAFSGRSNNLPAQLTPLVGREQEIAAVRAQLQHPDVRLLTLLGPGGIGKTRLGVQVASEIEGGFAHGVCFVSLASVRDPGQLFPTIAQALGLQPGEERSPLVQVQAYLRDKQVLLLLDNFEQLLPAAPKLIDLLASCPGLRLLVTSQAALHISGEYEFVVPPLTVPDLTHLPENEDLAHVATVSLFLQRAQAVQSGFQLTKANAHIIAEICTRLEGLPLAIELAAARIKLLPPPILLKRLGHRLEVLTGGMRDLSARQQTLRNTIQWSYALLSSEEQRLFRWLSVFRGGCTLEAVDAVYRAGTKQAADVLEGVASLLDKSLLRQMGQEDEEPRLMMLETIREYGLECLAASGELEAAQQAHAVYYLSLAEGVGTRLAQAVGIRRRPRNRRMPVEQVEWLERLGREYENLQAALEWSAAHGKEEMELALRLSGGLLSFWTWARESEE